MSFKNLSANDLFASVLTELRNVIHVFDGTKFDRTRFGELEQRCRDLSIPMTLLENRKDSLDSNKEALNLAKLVLLDCGKFFLSSSKPGDKDTVLSLHRRFDETLSRFVLPGNIGPQVAMTEEERFDARRERIQELLHVNRKGGEFTKLPESPSSIRRDYMNQLLITADNLRDVAALDLTELDHQSPRGTSALLGHGEASLATKFALLGTLKEELNMRALVGWNAGSPDEKAKLGLDGFSTVFRCQYQGREVALKRYDPIVVDGAMSEREILTFRKEACFLQYCAVNNHIIRFIGASVPDGILLTELAVCSLYALLHDREVVFPKLPNEVDKKHLLSFPYKASVVLDVASVLYFLHVHGVIHRDLRPGNVLLVPAPPTASRPYLTLVPKLSNFTYAISVSTVAVAESNHMSPARTCEGEVPYIAPEVLGGMTQVLPYTPAVDLYALGILANEVFTEQSPWKGLIRRDIKARVCAKDLRPDPYVPVDALQQRVMAEVVGDSASGCLHRLPAERPSAKSLCAETGALRAAAGKGKHPAASSPMPPNTQAQAQAHSPTPPLAPQAAQHKQEQEKAQAQCEASRPAASSRASFAAQQAASMQGATRVSDIFAAIHQGDAANLKSVLIKAPFGLVTSEADGRTPLTYAAKRGNLELMDLLIEHGAEVNHHDTKDGATAFMVAAREDHIALMHMLHSDHGADVNALDKSGFTSLMMAAGRNKLEAVHALVSMGADLEITDRTGCTALILAAHSGCEEAVGLLLRAGANVKHRNIYKLAAADTSQVKIQQYFERWSKEPFFEEEPRLTPAPAAPAPPKPAPVPAVPVPPAVTAPVPPKPVPIPVTPFPATKTDPAAPVPPKPVPIPVTPFPATKTDPAAPAPAPNPKPDVPAPPSVKFDVPPSPLVLPVPVVDPTLASAEGTTPLSPSFIPTPSTGQGTPQPPGRSNSSARPASEGSATDERVLERRGSFAHSPFSRLWRVGSTSADPNDGDLLRSFSSQTLATDYSVDDADDFVCGWTTGLQLSESWTDEQCVAHLASLYTELKRHAEIAGPRCEWDAKMKAVNARLECERAKPNADRDLVQYAALQKDRARLMKAAPDSRSLGEEDFQRWEGRKTALTAMVSDMANYMFSLGDDIAEEATELLTSIAMLQMDLQRLKLPIPVHQSAAGHKGAAPNGGAVPKAGAAAAPSDQYFYEEKPLQDVQSLVSGDAPRLLLRGHFNVPQYDHGKERVDIQCVIKCAYKKLGDAADPELLRLLTQEYEIYDYLQKRTKDTGCVYCYDLNRDCGYLLLRKHGEDLAAMLSRKVFRDKDMVKGIADAVNSLHALGVMHGDIKPKNILVYFDEGGICQVKLCDLDVAHKFNYECDPSMLGSPNYIVPEVRAAQLGGVTVTASAEIDMFALGLVLWQVLSHQPKAALGGYSVDLDKCYADQEALWACIPCTDPYFKPVLRALTSLHPHDRLYSRQFADSLSSYTPSNMHQRAHTAEAKAEALQEEVGRQLNSLQDGVSKLLAGQEKLTRSMDLMVASNKQLVSMVSTLVSVAHTLPTLAIIVKDSSGYKSYDIFKDHYRLYFLCGHTHAIAPCGPKGKGYKIQVVKQWVQKMAPVIHVSLVLLKIALLASGLPIPVPQLESFLGNSMIDADFIEEAQKFSRSLTAYQMVNHIADEVRHMDMGSIMLGGKKATIWTLEETAEAYRTIAMALEDHSNVVSNCGLQEVRHEEHHAWILKGDKAKEAWIASLSAKQSAK